MRASVVVCAYTELRWDDTVAAIASLQEQTPAPDEIVLVIDHHPALARRAEQHWPHGVTVRENDHRQGLAGARNTGLDAVTGDVVAFLDDDARARPGWLAGLLAPFADDAVVATGGLAQPEWAGRRRAPGCLPPELWWVVGCSYTGQRPGDDTPDDTPEDTPEGTARVEVRNVLGCSMALRRAPVVALGGFTESMGRRGTLPLGCEETDLCIRLRQARPDARIVLVPDAVVDHRVPDVRASWRYLLRRCWSEGRSKAALARAVGTDDGLSSERSYAASVMPRAMAREVRTVLGRHTPRGDRGRAARGALAVPAALVSAGAGYVVGLALTVRSAGWTAGAGARRAASAALIVVGLAACGAALLSLEGGVRLALTGLFLVLGPGWAIAGFLRGPSTALAWATACGAGSAVAVLGGQTMVLTGAWYPQAALGVVAVVTVPALFRHLVAVR